MSIKNIVLKILAIVIGLGFARAAVVEILPAAKCVPWDLADLKYEDVDKNLVQGVEKNILAQSVFADQSSDVNEIDIPDKASRAAVTWTRTNWVDKGDGVTVLEAWVDMFNGKEWVLGDSSHPFKTDGGDRVDNCGNTTSISYWEFGLLEGSSRKLRVNTKTHEDINTSMSVYFK